ncbi:RmlC-like cupin domain-containing protein [Xylaria flabelliformis]|nr:RmlC-like cupin domain-containing protein [Xylaria flabelliformis]
MAAEDPKYDRSRPLPSLEVVFQNKLGNAPGKTILGMVVTFPPNASTPPHRHGGTSVTAYVLEGTLLNKMNNDPTQVISAGGTWYEAPGCHHKISDNHSKTEQAKLLATFIVDTQVLEEQGMSALLQVDEEYKDVELGG